MVVEATATGGARITAGYAGDYGRDVYALPGSRRNPAAAGCNALIADGAEPLLDPGDLLVALGPGRQPARAAGAPTERTDRPTGTKRPCCTRWAATRRRSTTSSASTRPRLRPASGAALGRLERAGRVQRRRGLWWPELSGSAPDEFLQLRRRLPTI